MEADLPPHPGARPEEFEFPFAEARAALDAAEALVDGLVAALDTHREAVGAARADFRGQTRQEFDRGFDEATDALDALVDALRRDATDLNQDIETAQQRREASLDAIDRYDVALSRYRSAAAEAVAG